MKANEIIPRQNRIIYILMFVLAAAVLAYVLWKPAPSDHKSVINRPQPTPTESPQPTP